MNLASPKSTVQGRRDLNINIPLPDLAKGGVRNGSMTDLSIRTFNNALHAFQFNRTPSYIAAQFHMAIEDFKAGRMAQHELFRYTEVLMRYAHDFSTNRLREGATSFVWNANEGWYAGLNRIATLGLTQPVQCESLPWYRLKRLQSTEALYVEMLEWSAALRGDAVSLNGLHGRNSLFMLPTVVPGTEARLGYRPSGEIVFSFVQGPAHFKVTLVPQLGPEKSFSGHYIVCLQWNTASDSPRADFALEDLAAKALPFGGLNLHGEESSSPLFT